MEIFENNCENTTEINEVVYANSCWHTAEMCEIVDFIKNESSTHKNVYKLHSLSFGGNFAITEDYVFRTRKEALDAAEKERQTIIENYKQEIKDLNDLIRFPLKHCFHGDEYTDENAVCAYKIRAKELTGLDLVNCFDL